MRILVIGADTMLGKDLMGVYSRDPEVLGVNQANLELWDLDRIREIVSRYKPLVVIHAAESSDVDECESKPWETLQMNALGTQNVAMACQEVDAAMVYISSDQIFDGTKKGPYVEWDPPSPLNIYGHSKMAGEMAVRDHLQKFFIVRTSGMYGRHGVSFASQVVSAAREQQILTVPNDEATLPTYTRDLARAMYRLVGSRYFGIYHVTNSGDRSGLTWYEWAQAILQEAGLPPDAVAGAPGSSLKRNARRPPRPVLGNTFYRMRKLPTLPSCLDALKSFFKDLTGGDESTAQGRGRR